MAFVPYLFAVFVKLSPCKNFT